MCPATRPLWLAIWYRSKPQAIASIRSISSTYSPKPTTSSHQRFEALDESFGIIGDSAPRRRQRGKKRHAHLAHQLQRNRAGAHRNLDQQRRAGRVARIENLQGEIARRTLHADVYVIGHHRLARHGHILRPGVDHLHLVGRTEKDFARRRHSSLSHLAPREVLERERIAPASGNGELTPAAAGRHHRPPLRLIRLLIELGLLDDLPASVADIALQ